MKMKIEKTDHINSGIAAKKSRMNWTKKEFLRKNGVHNGDKQQNVPEVYTPHCKEKRQIGCWYTP